MNCLRSAGKGQLLMIKYFFHRLKKQNKISPLSLKYLSLSLPVLPPKRYYRENIWPSINSAPYECVRKGLRKTLVLLPHSRINQGTGPSQHIIDNSTKLYLLWQSLEAILALPAVFIFQRHSCSFHCSLSLIHKSYTNIP